MKGADVSVEQNCCQYWLLLMVDHLAHQERLLWDVNAGVHSVEPEWQFWYCISFNITNILLTSVDCLPSTCLSVGLLFYHSVCPSISIFKILLLHKFLSI